jgi:hypothetical protein
VSDTPIYDAIPNAARVEALLATPVPSAADITAAAEGARDGE